MLLEYIVCHKILIEFDAFKCGPNRINKLGRRALGNLRFILLHEYYT